MQKENTLILALAGERLFTDRMVPNKIQIDICENTFPRCCVCRSRYFARNPKNSPEINIKIVNKTCLDTGIVFSRFRTAFKNRIKRSSPQYPCPFDKRRQTTAAPCFLYQSEFIGAALSAPSEWPGDSVQSAPSASPTTGFAAGRKPFPPKSAF